MIRLIVVQNIRMMPFFKQDGIWLCNIAGLFIYAEVYALDKNGSGFIVASFIRRK